MSKLDKSINNLLKVAQEEFGEKYKKKTRQDKLTCIICNGKYTRQCRISHIKSQKHILREKKLIDDIKRELLYFIPKKKTKFQIEIEELSCSRSDRLRELVSLEKLNNSIPKFNLEKAMKELEQLEKNRKKRYITK